MNQSVFFYLTWIIQIISESLPISSSTHVKLFGKFLNPEFRFTEKFEHALHLPSIIILVVFLINSSLMLISRNILNLNYFFKICFLVFIADILTVLLYCFFKYFKVKIPLSLGLFITSLSLYSLYFFIPGGCPSHTLQEINLNHAIFISFAQAIALLPGVSRLALTIVGCSFFNFDPLIAVTFSCAIQLPLILVAVAKILIYDASIYKMFKLNIIKIIFLVLACLLAYYLLWLIVFLLKKNLLWIFGFYMLIPIIIRVFVKY